VTTSTTATSGLDSSARFQVRVDPDAIELAASRLSYMARHLADIGTELGEHFTSVDVDSWAGLTRDAMTAELDTLATHVARFPDHFTAAAAALDALAEVARETLATVRRANADWTASQDAYAAASRTAQQAYRTTVRDLETGTDPATVADDRSRAAGIRDAAIRRAASNRDITDGYTARAVDGAVAALEDEARRAGAALGGAVLPGTGTPSTVPVCRAPLPPATVADLLGLTQTVRRFTEHWDDFDSQEAASEAGRENAERVGRLSGDDTDPDAVADLLRYATNPAFARGVAERLGAGGLTTLPYYIATNLAATVPREDGELEDLQAQADALATGLARVLATVSADGAFAAGFGADLVRAALDVPGSAYGLSVLLSRTDGMDRDLARALATGLYEADRDDDSFILWLDLGNRTGALPTLFGSDAWWDPMVGVSELLADDPALAQEFLLGSGPQDGSGNRIARLTGRYWGSDDGDALGHLLEAATTTRDGGPAGGSTGWRSATILSQALRAWRDDDGGYDVPEHARDSVGLILGVYFPELQNALGQSPAGAKDLTVGRLAAPDGTRSTWAPLLGRSDADALLEAVVGDDRAFASLVAAQQVTLRAAMDDVLGGPEARTMTDDELRDAIRTAARVNGTSWGAVLDTANLSRIADAQDEDDRRQLVIDLLDAATGYFDVPGSDFYRGVSKLVIEAIVEDATSPDGLSLHSGSEGGARVAASSAWATAQGAAVDEVVSLLFEHDYFAPGGRYADVSPEATLHVDSSSFLDGNGHLLRPASMSDQVRADYEAWLNASGIGNLETTVGQAFDTAQRDYQG